MLRAYVKKYKSIEQEIECFKADPGREPSDLLKSAMTTNGTTACAHPQCCQPPHNMVQKVLDHPSLAGRYASV